MTNSMSCSDGRWCTRADALPGVEGLHVNSVTGTGTGLVLRIETGGELVGFPDCGVVAVGHGRRQVRLHDIPCFGRPVRLLWACIS
jgi:transposase